MSLGRGKRPFRRRPRRSVGKGNTAGQMFNKRFDRRVEKKELIVFQDGVSVSTSGLLVDLSQISEGSANGERSGLAIRPKELSFHYENLTTDATNKTRIMIVIWRDDTAQNNATLAQIYQDVTNALPLSPYHFANYPSKFQVIYDKIHYLDLITDAVAGAKVVIRKKLPAQIYFNAGATTGTNKIFLVMWSDSGAASHPTITLSGKFVYTDA